jgi:hypothetical protein
MLMITMHPLKALFLRLLPAFSAAVVLGTTLGYSVHESMTGGCCHAGSPCCHPGSPCCGGHAAPGGRVAMK